MSRFAYLDAPTPIAFAHRGGAKYPPNLGIENSAAAFRNAAALGFSYFETDVRASSDGIVYAFHDEDLERVAGTPGVLHSFSSDELENARIGGREPVPRLRDLLAEHGQGRFNIDVKDHRTVGPVVAVVRELAAQDRVCFASFSHRRIRQLRALAPEIATSFSPYEVACLRLGRSRRVRSVGVRGGGACVQVPPRRGPFPLVTRRLVADAHALGVPVHVWTIDDPDEMTALLDLGVDGVMSDRIDVLAAVVATRRSGTMTPDDPIEP